MTLHNLHRFKVDRSTVARGEGKNYADILRLTNMKTLFFYKLAYKLQKNQAEQTLVHSRSIYAT